MLLLDNDGFDGLSAALEESFSAVAELLEMAMLYLTVGGLVAFCVGSLRSFFVGSRQIPTMATRLERLLLLLAGIGRTNR